MKIGIKEVNTNQATFKSEIVIIDGIAYIKVGASKDDKVYVMQPSMIKDMIMPALRNFCKKYTDEDIEVEDKKLDDPF